jgi:hypothetical protein
MAVRTVTILISTTIAAVARSAQAELHLSARTSRDPVFIGVGPAGVGDGYFAGADIDNVEDVEVDPFRVDVEHHAGTARPGSPDGQTFWVAKSSGAEASLDWQVRDGTYRIVVMNAEADPGVAVEGRFTLGIPDLYGVGVAAFIDGGVGVAVGLMLVVVGFGKRRALREGQRAVQAVVVTVELTAHGPPNPALDRRLISVGQPHTIVRLARWSTSLSAWQAALQR